MHQHRLQDDRDDQKDDGKGPLKGRQRVLPDDMELQDAGELEVQQGGGGDGGQHGPAEKDQVAVPEQGLEPPKETHGFGGTRYRRGF
jgi:hypothetical protein